MSTTTETHPTPDQRLAFARWLYQTGRLTDGPVPEPAFPQPPAPPTAPTAPTARRLLSPERQLANVAAFLLAQVRVSLEPRRNGQHATITRLAEQLEAMAAAHARGELPALVDDGTPF